MKAVKKTVNVGPVLETDQPNESWEVDRLAEYALNVFSEADVLVRKSAVLLFRAGHAMWIARVKLKLKAAWCKWLEAKGIARTSAWEAIELYERAGSETALSNLSLTTAKRHFGITKPAKKKKAPILRLAGDSGHESETSARGNQPTGGGNPTPPPKEPPDSPLHVLCKIESCLQTLADETDWRKESSDQTLRILNRIYGTLDRIKQEVASAAA